MRIVRSDGCNPALLECPEQWQRRVVGPLHAQHHLVVRVVELTGAPEVLLYTNLSLWVDKPMILGLARTESSDQALMVVIHCTLERPQNGPSKAADRD